MSNTLDGWWILLGGSGPVFWEQGGMAGLVVAFSREDAMTFADWHWELRGGDPLRPYFIGSRGLPWVEEEAHHVGEGLDVVYVLDCSSGGPRFMSVPPREFHWLGG